jgi:acyl carrier protein
MSGELKAEIAAIVGALLDVPTTTRLLETRNLAELGLSSRQSIELVVALEKRFGIEIPDRALRPETFNSLESICATLSELVEI